jgi:hypothetical protein
MKRSKLIATFIGLALFIMPPSILSQGTRGQIEFDVTGDNNVPGTPGHPKVPVPLPNLWQNGYQLDFYGPHPDYVLRIVDATNTPVYVTAVPSSQTQVMLPTTLSGTYRIELIMGSWLFYGFIDL